MTAMTVRVNVKNMTDVVRALTQATGASIPQVIDHEAARILEKAVALTPAANISKIRTNAESREWGMHKTGWTPKRPFKGKLTKRGFKRYNYGNRYPDQLWQIISNQRKASLELKMSRRGLSKRTWLKLAEAMGLEIKVPGYVKKANAPAGTDAKNFHAARVKRGDLYILTFRTIQPTIRYIGGRKIIRQAIEGRIAFFRKNLEKGVFTEFEQVAKKYPGLIRVVGTGSGGTFLE